MAQIKKRYDVMLPKEVEGREKSIWKHVGKIVEFDTGNMILELNHSNETFSVFEEKAREELEQ